MLGSDSRGDDHPAASRLDEPAGQRARPVPLVGAAVVRRGSRSPARRSARGPASSRAGRGRSSSARGPLLAVFVVARRPGEPLLGVHAGGRRARRRHGRVDDRRLVGTAFRSRARRVCGCLPDGSAPAAGGRRSSRVGCGRRDRRRGRRRRHVDRRTQCRARRVDRARAGSRCSRTSHAAGDARRGRPRPAAVGRLGRRRRRRGSRCAIGLLDALLGWPEHRPRRSRSAPTLVRAVRGRAVVGRHARACASTGCSCARSRRAASSSIVGVVYLVVVLGFGDAPDRRERRVLGLSMVAAAIAALLYVPVTQPARRSREPPRLRRAPRARRAAADLRRAHVARDPARRAAAAARGVAEEEHAARRGRGVDRYRRRARARRRPCRTASPPRIRLDDDEAHGRRPRARVRATRGCRCGCPTLLAEHAGRTLRGRAARALRRAARPRRLRAQRRATRRSPTRTNGCSPSSPARSRWRCTTRALDTALQASLDDLRVANDELRASRARIVAAADQSRRQIERNLHDGAQQHLVALAVKLGLARQLVEADPGDGRDAARGAARRRAGDAHRAARARARHLPAAAHGPRPPRSAARRREPVACSPPTSTPTSAATRPTSRPPSTSAASRRCRTPASTRARARASRSRSSERDGELRFEVADNGAGLRRHEPARSRGHGFVNMADRLGAIGGTLDVDSAPGAGTQIRGEIPLDRSPLGRGLRRGLSGRRRVS